MKRRKGGGVAAGLLAAAGLTAGAAYAQSDSERMLRNVADASDADLSGLNQGLPLVRTLESRDDRELTQVYVVRVAAPVPFVMDQIRRHHLLLDDAETRGSFSDPPASEDLSALRLSRSQLRDLEGCRPRDCDVKLPLETIERMHRTIDWSSPSLQDDVTRFFRGVLVERVARYASGADGDGFSYGDKEEPLIVAEGFDQLFDGTRYLDELDGPLQRHLRSFPLSSTGVDDVFTWTVEDLGQKTLVSLNHIAFKPESATTGAAVIGVKRIYASHYFHAALRIISVTPANRDGSHSYVTVVIRLRFDGELGGIRRVATERRLERNAEDMLIAAKRRLDTSYLLAAAGN